MPLPINLDSLFIGRMVEWDRLSWELELSEGRGTGIPKILRVMEDNGSQAAAFETDDARISLLVRLPVRRTPEGHSLGTVGSGEQLISKVTKNVTSKGTSKIQLEVLKLCRRTMPISDILEKVNRSNRSKFRNEVINPLLEQGFLDMTHPELPTHRNQRYFTTSLGEQLL